MNELCLRIDNEDYFITVFPWSIKDLEDVLKITSTPTEKKVILRKELYIWITKSR